MAAPPTAHQVWRIVERNGSRMVDTKGQPHALSRGADASLARYRDQSCDFSLQLLRGAARAHLPGRVLLSGRCEWRCVRLQKARTP